MANIKITLERPIVDQMEISFKAPCNCNQVTGIKVCYKDTAGQDANQVFSFRDACNNDLTGIGGMFVQGAVVDVRLDTVNSRAYLLNANPSPALIGAAPADHGHAASAITAGTLAGKVKAKDDTDYTTYQLRNVAILSATPGSMTNGTIALVYN